jgi:type VI secretion system secreted protein Hcp
MALDMFLTLDGIAGESTDPVHKGAIEISSWSWGLSEPASLASAGAARWSSKALWFIKMWTLRRRC